MLCLSIVLGFYTLDVYKTFGQRNPITSGEWYLTEVGSIGGIFGSFRFIWSALLDKFSVKKVYGLLLIFQMMLAFTMKWAQLNVWTYAVSVCLIIWCEGAHFTLAPNILKIIYGNLATELFGVLFTWTGVTSLILICFLASPLGDLYITFYFLTGIFSLLALLILIFAFKTDIYSFK